MGKKVDSTKIELAHLLYMQGETKKNICERVGITPKTLGDYILAEGWENKRAARNITRQELVNKILLNINKLLDSELEKSDNKEDLNFTALSDQLSKLAKTIEYLDKKSSVVDDMGVFMAFVKYLQSESENEKEITVDFIKKVNKFQDQYITRKMAK